MLSSLDCLPTKAGGAVNGSAYALFILTFDWLDWLCYLLNILSFHAFHFCLLNFLVFVAACSPISKKKCV